MLSTRRPKAKSRGRLAVLFVKSLALVRQRERRRTKCCTARPSPTARPSRFPELLSFRPDKRHPVDGRSSPGPIRPPALYPTARRRWRCSSFSKWPEAASLLENGYAIAATDYPGLGTPGPHPYLVGDSEARAVIDSVRAARSFPGLENSTRYAVWGHSQGGQAALFTGMIAKSYAPELQLVGVAAAAPATDLSALMTDDLNTVGGRNLTAMTMWSWARVFNAPINQVVEPAAMPTVDALANQCIEGAFDLYAQGEDVRAVGEDILIGQKSRDG